MKKSKAEAEQGTNRASALLRGAALGCLALASACGDDQDNRDTTAPTVSLTAPRTTVEGGETVAITVSAADNVDTSLQPSLTCSGGTLAGALLITGPVTSNATITCTATAVDAAGNQGSGSIQITVRPTVASLAAESTSTVRPGEVAVLGATDLSLSKARYVGTFGGRDVTLVRTTGGTLAFLTPDDLTPGDYRLTAVIGDRRYDLPFQVAAAPAIADPRAAVLAALIDARTRGEALAGAGDLSPTQEALVSAARNAVGEAIAGIDSFSETDLRRMAMIVTVNAPFTSGDAMTRAFVSADCGFALARSTGRLGLIAFVIGAGAIGGSGLGGPLGPAVGVLAAAALLKFTAAGPRLIRDTVSDVRTNCLSEAETAFASLSTGTTRPGSSDAKTLAVAQRYGFRKIEPRAFVLRQIRAIDPSVAGRVARLRDLALQSLGLLPASVSAGLSDSVATIEQPETRDVPAAEISLGGISRAEVTGTKGGSGTSFMLAFNASDSITENIDFDVTLNRTGEAPVTFLAQLVLDLPGADDAALTVTQGQTARSTLQVRGASSLEIVEQPAHGAATLSPTGELTYTPFGTYAGTDRFTYRARNSNGVSRTATVLINIVRRFEGVWQVSTRSTTISESQPGLCPVEAYTFSVNVVKASDTACYVDLPVGRLNLTQGSADDPAGLSGTITGTYEDDPGRTTETVTIRIPTSTQLEGSSAFQYSGSGGTTCSGTGRIQGVRP